MLKSRPDLPFPRKEQRSEYGRPNDPREVTTLLPPSCARCGAPLPAVAADPTHPEWCGACAARALDAPGIPPTVPTTSGRASQAPWGNPATAPEAPGGPALVVRTRPFDGILTGLAASAIAGSIWWGAAVAIASKTDFELWHLGSIIVGLIVGVGVLTGSRRGGLVSGLGALVLSAATVVVTVYFIDRSLTIIGLTDAGRTSDIPLWQGWSEAIDVYRSWWDFDQTRVLMWLGGPLVAVLIAGRPDRRPIVG